MKINIITIIALFGSLFQGSANAAQPTDWQLIIADDFSVSYHGMSEKISETSQLKSELAWKKANIALEIGFFSGASINKTNIFSSDEVNSELLVLQIESIEARLENFNTCQASKKLTSYWLNKINNVFRRNALSVFNRIQALDEDRIIYVILAARKAKTFFPKSIVIQFPQTMTINGFSSPVSFVYAAISQKYNLPGLSDKRFDSVKSAKQKALNMMINEHIKLNPCVR